MTLVQRARHITQWTIVQLDRLSPAIDLLIRLWVANVFWKSGLTKIATWDSTLYLFEYEYAVPLLSVQMAAVIGTGIELAMPVLLVAGLGGRFSASVLFVFNIIAVLSYPTLNALGAKDHQYWGLLLLVTILHGPGRISVDYYLRKRFWRSHED